MALRLSERGKGAKLSGPDDIMAPIYGACTRGEINFWMQIRDVNVG
jgi:hypothetical protein